VVRKLGEGKRTQLVTIFFSVLLISPLYINAAANPSFLNTLSLNSLFNIPTVTETITQKSVLILGEAKTFDENVMVTTWPDGTKQINFSWSCPQLSEDIRNFCYEASVVIQSEKQSQQANILPIAHAELPPWPTPQKPPPAKIPPHGVDYDWTDGLIFLRQGVQHPTGEDPFWIKYHQDDNWYNYYPRNWWDDWSYDGNTLIHWHIGKPQIEKVLQNEVDDATFAMWEWTLGSTALGMGSSAAGYFGATAAEGSLASVAGPEVAVVLGIAQGFMSLMATYYSELRVTRTNYYHNTVETDKGDAFGWLSICTTADVIDVNRYYETKPGCDVYCLFKRSWSVQLGMDPNIIPQRTQWELTTDRLPQPPFAGTNIVSK
jgi:hypothetical protein